VSERTTVVLHPLHLSGVREALAQIPDISLVCPMAESDIEAALARDAVFVTYIWSDAYLQPGLRWLQSHSAGYNQYPIDKLRERGVVLTSASGVHIVCAEHAIGLLLALTRHIHLGIRDMPSRRWDTHVAPEVAGRTVVIAGLGAIGEAIAVRLAGWDVRLIGVTRSPKDYRGALHDVRPLSALADACREASILMVALPLAPETRHLVSAEVLDALGAGWVTNVSRGPVIDEAALIQRLRDGRLLGAGLDVTETEPLPADSPLWDMPNVVITPHMAGLTPRYGERLAKLLTENLRAYRGEGPWRNRIV
jgi:phosphoglycerate dehydrogenase-like enzyme